MYDGQFSKDKREGYGVKIYPDGTIFEGFWENDQKHGTGTVTLSGNIDEIYQVEYDYDIQIC